MLKVVRLAATACLTLGFALVMAGCEAEKPIPKRVTQPFQHSIEQGDVRVTLLMVQRRNVFVAGEGTNATRKVRGVAIAYAVEPTKSGVTNVALLTPPVLPMTQNEQILVGEDKAALPEGFFPAGLRTFQFDEFKGQFFPYNPFPALNNPSNAIVYYIEEYGIQLTNRVVSLGIRAMLPGASKDQLFVFKRVPVD